MVAFGVVDPKRIYGRWQSLDRWNSINCGGFAFYHVDGSFVGSNKPRNCFKGQEV